jgi:uncharacterized RDD family membrane protein YckC
VSRPRLLRLSLRLPEGVTFSYALAGPFSRFAAWAVDFAVVAAAWMVLRGLSGFLSLVGEDFAAAVSIVMYFLLSTFYMIVLEWLWDGQTLGKRLCRLRVMDASGMRLRFSQVFLRNLLRVVDSLPLAYALGGASTALSAKAQRLGDIAAGTVVVHESQPLIPDWGRAQSPKFNSLRKSRQGVARLRQNTRPGEAAIALQALLNREALQSSARVELFALLAAHFREKAKFPEADLEGISDEQFVRDVTDILFVTDLHGPALAGA